MLLLYNARVLCIYTNYRSCQKNEKLTHPDNVIGKQLLTRKWHFNVTAPMTLINKNFFDIFVQTMDFLKIPSFLERDASGPIRTGSPIAEISSDMIDVLKGEIIIS